ncbi:hypothetical protein D3C87_1992490 [compost metagenome]
MNGRLGPAGMPPSPALGGDGGRPDRAALRGGHQLKTGSEAALREAKELSTPVLARPRVATQERAPAMMAPEIVVKVM